MNSNGPTADTRVPPWLLLALIGTYLATVAIVVIEGAQPIVDDWIYIDAAHRFAESGRVDISLLSVPVAVFEAVYGGVVLWIFGGSTTTLTLASAALAAGAGFAFYDLMSRSGLRQSSSVLAVGVLLFSAVFYGLSTTFMTDAHALGLVVISAALLSRGIDDVGGARLWLLAGSLAAAAAYLSRPGSLAVVAGVIVVAASRREWSSLRWALALPAATVAIHLSIQSSRGMPAARAEILGGLSLPSPSSLGDIILVSAVVLGIWLLPLTPAIAGSLYRHRSRLRVGWLFLTAGLVFVVALLMSGVPRLGNWLNPSGMFPIDESTVGSRPALIGQSAYAVVVIAALLISAVAFAATSGSSVKPRLKSAEIGLWAVAGISVLLSLVSLVATSGTMLDRYLVVLLPAVLFSLAVRGLSPEPVPFRRAAWMMLGVTAILSVVLAIDGVRLQNAIFATADSAVVRGIPSAEIDGGAAWTGLTFGRTIAPDEVVLPEGPHWWRSTFAPGLEPRYVVALNPADEACARSAVDVRAVIGPDQRVALIDTSC